MYAKFRTFIALHGVVACLLSFSVPARPAAAPQVGRILDSNATTLRGLAVPMSGTILSGDVVSTYTEGNAVIELRSGTKLSIRENSSVRFLLAGNKVQADLIAGEILSEGVGRPTLVVTTANYHFTPSQEGECRFVVALTKQRDTVAGAMRGSLLVTTPDSLANYILPEGEYAAIPASSMGVPPQERPATEPAAVEPAAIIREIIPEEVVQRRGESGALPLQLRDNINVEDTVRTLKNGKVRLELPDGSFLNLGARSVMRIVHQDAAAQHTQVELTLGEMRAEVAKLTKPDANFEVRTMTAKISTIGAKVIVRALTNLTEVYCLEGACSVQNIDPSIPGQATLHDGESTSIPGGLGPTTAVETPLPQLQSQVRETDVGTSTVEAVKTSETSSGIPGGDSGATGGTPWHIGSLSEGTSILILLGIGGGAAGAAIAAASGHSHSGAGPASPSAP
jgi:ferric-dicitrate binding protein FerR (iron transport regulator)